MTEEASTSTAHEEESPVPIFDPKKPVVYLKITDEDLKIITPSKIIIAGPSMVGKSTLISKFIQYREQMFTNRFYRIIFCGPQEESMVAGKTKTYYNNLKEMCPDIEFVKGIPKTEDLNIVEDNMHKLLLIDDLGADAYNSDEIYEIFCRKSHHQNITVILVTQSYFLPSKYGTSLHRNANYKIFFYDPGDKNYLIQVKLNYT